MLLLCNTILYSQDLPTKNEVTIPSEEIQDSITVPIKPIISEINEAVTDTVKTDSIKPQKETLTDVVDYYGEDYVYMNQKERKVYMRNKAYVIYGDMRIDAGLIILDYNKNEVYAKGIDSAGVYSQSPKFKQGANEVKPDSIRFNFDTEKALIYNSRTEQNGFNVIAEITKRENDSVVYLQNVKFTTSKNIDDPEYYFYTRRAKFVPKKKIVTGLTNMYIADVPTPIGLPFAFFPLTEDRASGVIIPTIGDNGSRGFFFQNGGYYFAVNDFLDLTVLGDYYTNGSYGLRAESTYAVRYKYRGNVSLRYENLIDSERGFDDFAQSTVYNIRWSHSQDTKASPNSRFSASVNLGSSRYFQESINQTNNASALVNTLSSSVSYSKTFEGEPQVNTAISATHSQNTNTQQITMSLPSVTTSVSRIFPFAPKAGVKKGIIDNINLQYDFTGDNRINTVDSLFFKKEMFDNALVGMRHRIPVSTNFKVLKYLSASANTTYQETWTLKTFDKSYDATANDGDGGVVTDTISGFDSYRTYNFSTSLGTTVYGTFNFGKKRKVQAVRHVMRPNVSYNINPGFNQYYDEYNIPVVSADPDINEEVVEYSRFEGTLYGAPGQTSTSSIGLSLSNTLEAKVRDKDTTATEAKKVVLLNNLNFGTSYNLRGDSLNWSPVSFSGSIPIIPKLDLNFSGSLDPYALDNNNQRIDQFNIDNGGSLFRLTGANISVNYNFSSKDFEGKKEDDFENDTFRNGGRPDDLFGDATNINDGQIFADDSDSEVDENRDWYNYSLPWDLRVAYTMSYSNSIRQNEISSQSLMFSSNVELSPRWKVGMSSGYDFKNKGVTLTQFRFQRDLESWQMSFNWTPIGSINTSWYFFVGIKSSVLSDIKYDKRREPDKNF
ncbi:organic solvent tolerance protein OstA [Ulvibacter litoralis]|nr:organic solvent tolerance protein OstA [Ulvibacter litoralis]